MMRRFVQCGLWLLFATGLYADVTVRYKMTVQPNAALPPQVQQSMGSVTQMPAPQILQIKDLRMVQRTGQFTTIFDGRDQRITIADHDKKIRTTVTAAEWAEALSQAISKTPANPHIQTTFDSKKSGRIEVIQGIEAEEREATLGIGVTAPPAPSVSMKMAIRIWTATAEAAARNPSVAEFAAFAKSAGSLMDPSSMLKGVFQAVPGLGASVEAMARDFQAAGGPMLRMDAEMHVSMPPEILEKMREQGVAFPNAGEPFMKMRSELVEISADPIEEAAFELPDGFRSTTASEIVASMTRLPSPPAPPTPPQTTEAKREFPGGVYRIGGGVTAPRLIHKVEPTYTEHARSAAVSGTVVLYVVVGEDGVPSNMKVVRGLSHGLDEKAMEAVRQWRFQPGQKEGKPVPVAAQIEVNFRLLNRPPENVP